MLSSERKATLAPQLVQTLIRQEIDPVTEISTTVTRPACRNLQLD